MRIRACLFAAAAAGLAFPVLAQEAPDADVAELTDLMTQITHPDFHMLPLELGESGEVIQTFRVTKTKTQGASVETGTAESQYSVKYETTGETYHVVKTNIRFDVIDSNRQPKPGQSALKATDGVMQKLVSLVSPISYTADDSLMPLSLDDWPALKARTIGFISDAMKESGEAVSAETAKTIGDALFGQMSEEGATKAFLQHDFLLSIPHNIGLKLNEPLSEESQIMAPMGGQVLDALETITLTHWDDATNTARVTYDFVPTADSMKSYITEFLPAFMKQVGAPQEAIDEMVVGMKAMPADEFLKVNTHCEYEMAIDTGLITKGVCDKAVIIKMMGQTGGNSEHIEFSEAFARKDIRRHSGKINLTILYDPPYKLIPGSVQLEQAAGLA